MFKMIYIPVDEKAQLLNLNSVNDVLKCLGVASIESLLIKPSKEYDGINIVSLCDQERVGKKNMFYTEGPLVILDKANSLKEFLINSEISPFKGLPVEKARYICTNINELKDIQAELDAID